MDVRLPDGTVIQNVPDNITRAELVSRLKAGGMAVPAEWVSQPEPSMVERAGAALRDVPRQVGLTARYGIEGLGRAAEVVTEPVRQLVVNPAMRALGGPQAQSTGDAASSLSDLMGLPKPATATERAVGEGARLMAGGGGLAGAATRGAQATTGAAKEVLTRLAAAPAQQVVGAGAAGLAGGSVKEAGGGPWEQFGASLTAGLAAPLTMQAAGSLLSGIKSAITPKMSPSQVDSVLKVEFSKAGVDWDGISATVKAQIREDAKKAVYSGQPINQEALARLAEFRRVGATPMLGDITQDPQLITQQRNLAKQMANTRGGGELPQLQNNNARAVLSTLDEAAPSPLDAYATGRRVISGVTAADAAKKGKVDALYSAARDSAGRSAELDGAAFARRVTADLRQNLSPKLGDEVDSVINDIATGKTPLTVEYAEQLKTMLGRKIEAAKGTQGDLAYAYGLVRKALEDAPIKGTAGGEAASAFGAARAAAKERFSWQESAPFIKDALGGVAPDKFVQKHVIGSSLEDLAKLRVHVKGDPETLQGVRRQLVDYIMQRGRADSRTTEFSGRGMEDGLKAIGTRKLELFFSPEEIANITAAVNVARYMQAQPIGSAVNNSNTAAMLAGKATDALSALTGIPGVGPIVTDPLARLSIGLQQMPLRNLSGGLVNKPPTTPGRPESALALLLASPSQAREKDKRN